jgi:hypothetical protein
MVPTKDVNDQQNLQLLPPFKIIVHFGKSRYINFIMHVDTMYT